jgi:predicted nucleotidyltransferase
VLGGSNFTLVTGAGDLDLLGEVTGGGTYRDLLSDTVQMSIFGYRCRVLSLEALIRVKRAAGRPKDLEAIAELEVIRQEGRKRGRRGAQG